MKNRLGLVLAVGMSLGVAACDTDYGSIDKDPYPFNVPIGGVWEGTFSYQPPAAADGTKPAAQPIDVTLAATETNEFWILEVNTVTGCLHVGYGSAYSRQTSIAANYGYGGSCTDSDGTTRGTGSLSGTAVLHNTLSLSFTETTEAGNTYATFAPTFTFDSFYLGGSSLATVAGNYTGAAGGALTIDGTGKLSGATIGTCAAAATVSLINATYDLYRVSYALSGCTAAGDQVLNGITMTGLGYLDAAKNFNLVLHGTETDGTPVLSADVFTPS